jgi:hypothetical protein
VGTNVVYAEQVNDPGWRGPRPGGVGRKEFFTSAIADTKDYVDELINKARAMIERHWGKK